MKFFKKLFNKLFNKDKKHNNNPDLQSEKSISSDNASPKLRNVNTPMDNNTSLLQIGVVFLAVVSFFTTANGMKTYIFINDSVIAYAASAAIQSILLALSMYLPQYLKGIRKQQGLNFIAKVVLYFAALLLTVVILFCSSWFSYVYIADIIHQDSWEDDSELLVQQTYRTELYDARDYAHAYRTYLEEDLGEKILRLEVQARELSDSNSISTIDWEQEKKDYSVENAGQTTASYMSTVIAAMERALGESSQEARDIAARAVADAKENISARMETIQQNLDIYNTNITNYNNQIADLTRRINNAAEGTDVQALSDSVNYYTELIKELVEQQTNLQKESIELDGALFRLSTYESILGLDSATSAISIRASLIQLQSEFFRQQPDAEKMLEVTASIFDNLRNASRESSENGGMTSEDSLTYTNLLVQMNQLLRNLTDYADVKEIELKLDELIADLRFINGTIEPEPNDTSLDSNAAGPEPDGISSAPGDIPLESSDESMEPDDSASEPDETFPEPDDSVSEPGDTTAESEDSSADAGDTPEPDNFSPESGNARSERNSWKKDWDARLEILKGQISALPKYSESEETSDKGTDVISESQFNILRNYDRDKSSQKLDDMTRRYISDHNAVYEGIIYLQSPYSHLAFFALVLAFSFDLAGFVFGVVIQGKSSKQNESRPFRRSPFVNGNKRMEWSILEPLNQYIVLTGDYESKDEIYYYKVFKNGLLDQWIVQDKFPYQKGIYIPDSEDPTKGKLIDGITQELLFAGQAEKPVDGIYTDCQLTFDEGGLILIQNDGKKSFIASINEYVPVHSYNPHKGENQTIPAKQLMKDEIHAQTAVVALTAKGTRVSAIYIIEE